MLVVVLDSVVIEVVVAATSIAGALVMVVVLSTCSVAVSVDCCKTVVTEVAVAIIVEDKVEVVVCVDITTTVEGLAVAVRVTVCLGMDRQLHALEMIGASLYPERHFGFGFATSLCRARLVGRGGAQFIRGIVVVLGTDVTAIAVTVEVLIVVTVAVVIVLVARICVVVCPLVNVTTTVVPTVCRDVLMAVLVTVATFVT